MNYALAYLAWDRRQALAQARDLPTAAPGAILFVDISGFTPLTNALVQQYGARRGADELARHLNHVYSALITEIERFGGSVINFSGDGITCWFAGLNVPAGVDPLQVASEQALASALALQAAIQPFAQFVVQRHLTITLAIKTTIAAGLTRRFVVGDPTIQRIDLLAGAALDRVAAAEQLAGKGELLIDRTAAGILQGTAIISEWRHDPASNETFAVVTGSRHTIPPAPIPVDETQLAEAEARSWILPAIYRRLQTEQSRFLAELRPATALFLRFGGLDYEQDPDAGARLDAYIRWVQGVVDRYEGAVIQVTTGDKGSYLYAAFGAPIAHGDDSQRAVATALSLRTPPESLAFIRSTQIGLSQGMMRVGAYGSPTRRTYGVLSDETIMAARLMTRATPGQILVSDRVAEAIGERYDLHDLGLLPLKGWAEPQAAFAVLGPRQQQNQPTVNRYTNPLVGRASELALLTAHFASTLAGQGSLIRIEGNAGVGKSHLAAVATAQAAAQGLQVARVACQSTEQGIAYSAAGQLLRTLLHLHNGASPAEQIAQLETVLQGYNPAWLVRMPLLGDLLGLPIADTPTTAAFEPRLRQAALISLTMEIIQATAQRQPLWLLWEDIHWLDESSHGILLALARQVEQLPILLLLLHRPVPSEEARFLQEITALPGQVSLHLQELEPAGLAELVSHRLHGTIDPLALALIQAQTQGNPFFAEEMVDALCDAGRLIPSASGWALAPALVETLRNADCLEEVAGQWTLAADAPLAAVDLGIPSTVQGIVLARLDRLPETAQLTLKVASVIGGLFEFTLLAQAHPLQPTVAILSEQMTFLVQREFARVETATPHLRYSFKHSITQEVAYQTLLADQRQELHQRVAEVLEEVHGERNEDLAFHYLRSDLQRGPVRDKALHYLDAAGQRAKHDYANETALSYFNRALELEMRWPWLKAKIDVLHILGRRAEQQTTLALLQVAPNAPAFDAALLWGEYYEAVSEYDEAEAALKSALTQARAVADQAGEARTLARLGMIAWRQGDYEAAEQAYHQALEVLGIDERFREEEAEVRYGLGLVYRRQGKYDQAQSQFQRDLMLNRLSENRQNEARSLDALGHVEHLKRDVEQAISFYQQALEIRQAIGDRAGVGVSLLSMAQGLGNVGDYGRAEPMLLQAMKIHQALNNRWWEMLVWTELGILYLMIGKLDNARSCFDAGLTLGQEIGDQSGQAYILCNLGQVLREQGKLAQAEKLLMDGLALLQSQGDLQAEATCWSDLALLSLRAEHYEEAIQRATMSREKFRALDLLLLTTTDLTILAAAHLALNQQDKALRYTQEALRLLDESEGEGPDFPQRDYWMCYQVLQAVGETELANHALHLAHRLLLVAADKITDSAMRESYLHNTPHNQAILSASAEQVAQQ